MNERQRRGGRDRGESRGSRESNQRRYGQDEPWREEQRTRYPNDSSGGERNRQFSGSGSWRDERTGWEGNQGWRGEGRRHPDDRGDVGPERYGEEPRQASGHGYGYGFSDSGDYRPERPAIGRSWESYSRGDDRGWGGRTMREEPGSWDQGRADGGYGSSDGPGNQGASFGFGPAEQPGRWDTGGYWSPYAQGDLNSGRMGPDRFRDTDWVPNRPARGRGTWAGDWADVTNYAGRGPKDYRRSDDRIREEICDVFTDDPTLDPGDVVVKVESGEVTLMGSVSTRDQKRRAEEDAERVSGVRDVINQLRVSRGETTTGTPASQPAGASRGSRASSSQQQPGVAADRENR